MLLKIKGATLVTLCSDIDLKLRRIFEVLMLFSRLFYILQIIVCIRIMRTVSNTG